MTRTAFAPPVAAPPVAAPPVAVPPDRPMLGIALMLASVALLPVMDGLAKAMTDVFAILQLVWARFLFQSLLIAPLALAGTPRELLSPRHLPLQVALGAGLIVGTFLFSSALRTMPTTAALDLRSIDPLTVTPHHSEYSRIGNWGVNPW